MDAANENAPCPQPFWWTKRLLLLALAIVLLNAAVFVYWQLSANTRLHAAQASVRAAGYAVFSEELPSADPLPDDQNAAIVWSDAASRVTTAGPANSSLVYQEYPQVPPEWHAMADQSVAANGQVFADVRSARALKKTAWVSSSAPAFPGFLSAQRALANELRDSALHAHHHGDDLTAIERCRDVIAQADAVAADPALISQVVAIGIHAATHHTLAVIAPDLQIPTDGANPLRASLKDVILELLDVGPHRENLTRSVVHELAAINSLENPSGRTHVIAPLFTLNVARANERGLAHLQALRSDEWSFEEELLEPLTIGHPLISQMHLGRIAVLSHKHIAIARMTAVSLAVQLYRSDHVGWPVSLDELVPNYLSAVPVDNFIKASRFGTSFSRTGVARSFIAEVKTV